MSSLVISLALRSSVVSWSKRIECTTKIITMECNEMINEDFDRLSFTHSLQGIRRNIYKIMLDNILNSMPKLCIKIDKFII